MTKESKIKLGQCLIEETINDFKLKAFYNMSEEDKDKFIEEEYKNTKKFIHDNNFIQLNDTMGKIFIEKITEDMDPMTAGTISAINNYLKRGAK